MKGLEGEFSSAHELLDNAGRRERLLQLDQAVAIERGKLRGTRVCDFIVQHDDQWHWRVAVSMMSKPTDMKAMSCALADGRCRIYAIAKTRAISRPGRSVTVEHS
jgi:hypothetical protein